MLDTLFKQLKTFENHRLTRLDLLRIEQLKNKYVQHYKSLPTRFFTINLEQYLAFLKLYNELKNSIGKRLPEKEKRRKTKIIFNKNLTSFINEYDENFIVNEDQSFITDTSFIIVEIDSATFVNVFLEQLLHFLLTKPRPLPITYPMANFDFNIAFKLDELSLTSAVKVEEFFGTVECYYDTLNEAGQTALIRFLIKSKIKGEAKIRLGACDATTLITLKAAVNQRVLAAETSEQLIKALQNTNQGRRSLTEFAKKLEDLATRMASASIREQPGLNAETTKTNCNRLALTQFKAACHDEYKTLLSAARPATLDDAVAVASSASVATREVFYYNSRGRGGRNFNSRGGRGSRNGNNNNNNRPNNPQRFNDRPNYNNDRQNYNTDHRGRRYNSNQSNGNYNRDYQNNNRNYQNNRGYNRQQNQNFQRRGNSSYHNNQRRVDTIDHQPSDRQQLQQQTGQQQCDVNTVHVIRD